MPSIAPAPDGHALPSEGSSGEDVLYRSDRTVISRKYVPAGSFILKRRTGTDAVRRLRHEKAVLEHLGAIDGVARLEEGSWPDDTLALHDDAGIALATHIASQRMPLDEILSLGVRLAHTLAAVHRRGVLHKDINPNNILLSGSGRRPVLIDFDIAALSSEDQAVYVHENRFAGTLAFMPPEQTGRTGRAVDQRSDLYAFGAVLYQLVTNRPLFRTNDLLDTHHKQLTAVPTAPALLVSGLPQTLSDLVMRLLEKEPDRRYQSAEGVAHDLERLAEMHAAGDASAFPLGARDFAARLMPPSRPIGRQHEIEALKATLAEAATEAGTCVLLEGGPGTGKTALVNELRPALAARHGWFISGKFHPHRQDAPTATILALVELGRLLLSKPEAELAVERKRLLEALGANVNAGITQIPEFELLLGSWPRPPDIDPQEAEKRMVQASIEVLRCVASYEHPIVMVLDDAQWAPEVSMRFVDAVLAARADMPGFMLVLAYRPPQDNDSSPLKAGLARWGRLETPPRHLAAGNLLATDIAELVGTMLRLSPDDAQRLGTLLEDRVHGNPQDTIELVNALRLDGLLQLGAAGWQWDGQAIRRYVGDNEGVDLLDRRLGKLPAPCLALMKILACLGGEAPSALLEAARENGGGLHATLAPALEDGLLVCETQRATIYRFRNNRVQERMHAQMSAAEKCSVQLGLARRLSERPAYARHAAQQYHDAIDAVTDNAERKRAAFLLRDAAIATQVVNYAVCERLLAAALQAVSPIEAPEDAALVQDLVIRRHQALSGLGRYDEADAVYRQVAARCADPFVLAEPAGLQLHNLASRGLYAEGLELGLQVLEQLGLPQPADMEAQITSRLRELCAWAASSEKEADFNRPDATDPQMLTLAVFIRRVFAPSFHSTNKKITTWLRLECHQLWMRHGPCAALMQSVATLPILLAAVGDYRGAYRAGEHAMAVGTARGYETGAALAIVFSGLSGKHWGDPVDDVPKLVKSALSGLTAAGDQFYKAFAYGIAVMSRLEAGTTLDEASEEVEAALAFVEESDLQAYKPGTLTWRQLIRAFRGQTHAPGSFEDDSFSIEHHQSAYASGATATELYNTLRAFSALVFNDHATLRRYAQTAHSQLPAMPGFYTNSLVYLSQAMSLAEQARQATDEAKPALLAEMDVCRKWMAERAADAPANFLHWVHLLEAEHTWTLGRTWEAAAAYERALAESARRMRPWHRALIHERCARFHLAQGHEHTARPLLLEALQRFENWGAAGKVRALLEEFPFLRQAAPARTARTTGRGTAASLDTVDMMAILRASQALSSETSLAQLSAQVVKVLGAMCGADSVQLLVRPPQMPGWFVADSLEAGCIPVTLEEAGAQGKLALSAFHYAERTREPLLVEDAMQDARFSGDSALAGLPHCSMLLVPILKQGEMRAMLVLHNRMRRSAFSADRLDAISLIAGQLAVSIDNTLLYAMLERKVAERTAALEEANHKLEALSVTDALTGLANRRAFNHALEVEWQRARRAGTPVGLAMIDIDQFKQYNDHYGHHGGDACLQVVADAMKSGLRAGTDLIARYGGEEFVLLLSDADIEDTRRCAERVRAAVAARLEPHLASVHGFVSVSIGVASCLPADGTPAAACLEAADAALYQAKRGGRNRVAG